MGIGAFKTRIHQDKKILERPVFGFMIGYVPMLMDLPTLMNSDNCSWWMLLLGSVGKLIFWHISIHAGDRRPCRGGQWGDSIGDMLDMCQS